MSELPKGRRRRRVVDPDDEHDLAMRNHPIQTTLEEN